MCTEVYRGVQYSVGGGDMLEVEVEVVVGVGGLESGDWWLLLH